LDNQFKIRKLTGPAHQRLPLATCASEFNVVLDTRSTSHHPYSPVACHLFFKASPTPIPTLAPLSIVREATTSPASLLSPSVLLRRIAKLLLTPPPVSYARVDWRFQLASPHHPLPICAGSRRLEPSHHRVFGSLPPLKYLVSEPSHATRTVLI
jgi:hypothetical protein